MRLKQSSLLNKIEEVDEIRGKNGTIEVLAERCNYGVMKSPQNKKKETMIVMQNVSTRPKSSSSRTDDDTSWKVTLKNKTHSSCVSSKRISQNELCSRRCNQKLEHLKQRDGEKIETIPVSSRLSGIACSFCQNHFVSERRDYLPSLCCWPSEEQKQTRNCRSAPNCLSSAGKGSSRVFNDFFNVDKFKRSLKLLGLEPFDFGIHDQRKENTPWIKKESLPTLSTKVICRTIPLDSLREVIREAWMEDCLGFNHRKLLSQAAYEEWYFRKEREWQINKKKKKIEEFESKEKICRNYELKKVRAEEEFRKWVLRKRAKRKEKGEKNFIKPHEQNHLFRKITKSKEEVEKAYQKWKKDKNKALRENNKKKRGEEEKKKESERQKLERKMVAEKAFQQWKNKVQEWEKCERERRQKKQEPLKRQEREKESKISFQIWKISKDEEIREKTKEMRNAAKLAKKERLARMEERLYEAEQAFEQWLEKLHLRKQMNEKTHEKNIPWMPA